MIRKCAVKGCDRPAIVGGIITGTKDVLLELCEYHRSQTLRVSSFSVSAGGDLIEE
jgi:hypothetical protein